jgi:hypothetical protein
MAFRGLFAIGMGIALAVACGGSVEGDKGNTGGDGGAPGGGGTGGTGGTHLGGTGGKDAGKDAKPDSKTGGTGGYIDPGCPDADPPPPQTECDLYDPSSCPPTLSCYPYVQYPSGPCGFEVYGTVCAVPGTGTQGDPCGGENCAGGFVCVITGQGTECVQICNLVGKDNCPDGLFCVPIDVEGVGGCY